MVYMVRKGLNVVYLTDKDVELIDRYIQAHYPELKKKREANRSAVAREAVKFWAEQKGLKEKNLSRKRRSESPPTR